eukprot:gene9972-11642_t
MEESHRQDLLQFLSVFQNLGGEHLRTLGGFMQHPQASLSSQVAGGDGVPTMNEQPWDANHRGDNRAAQHALMGIMKTVEYATEEQIDNMITIITKQMRGSLEHSDLQLATQIALALRIPYEQIEAVGRLYQSRLLFEVLTVHLTEDHLTKIQDALTAVFPHGDAMDMHLVQTYLLILQKLQQLFTTSRIDSILHLHSEINQQGVVFSLAQQQICETLDLKSDEYFLATALKSLLQIDESSLYALIDTFPKLKSLQLAQIALLPFKNIYEVYELRSNLCSLASTYSILPIPATPALPFTYALADPTKQINIKIIEQPPEKAVYKRNVKPCPTVMFEGDSTLLDGNYYVAATLLRCNNFQEEPSFIVGNKPMQVGSGRVVSFKKLKILVTSHQQGETLFCFRFDLRRYNSDAESNPSDFEVVASIHSNPICLLSHSTQLKHTTNVDLPSVGEAIPLGGPSAGGTRVAILGSNFADTPATRIRFGDIEIVPTFHSQGTLLCYAPPHVPATVQVHASNSPKHWSVAGAPYTYEAQSDIDARDNEAAALTLPRSELGLDFASTFAASFVIKGANSALTNLPSNSLAQRTSSNPSWGSNQYGLDSRGYSPLHYVAAFGSVVPLIETVRAIAALGPLLNAPDKYGNTPLHWAVSFGSVPTVSAFLDAGASAHLPNAIGISPLHVAIGLRSFDLAKLLIARGADINADDLDGVTPLHAAASVGDNSIMSLLLSHGANLYATDDEGDTALHMAIREEHLSTVSHLLEYSARREAQTMCSFSPYPFGQELPDAPLHSFQNSDGETPLHIATASNSRRIIELLVSYGAMSNIFDESNETALHIASNSGELEMFIFLSNYPLLNVSTKMSHFFEKRYLFTFGDHSLSMLTTRRSDV